MLKSELAGCGILLLVFMSAAQARQFSHVVLIIQENRTPDNLFQGLCTPPFGGSISCGPKPTQYNIQTSNWLNKNSSTGVTQPVAGPLQTTFQLGHDHNAFKTMCDRDPVSGICKMDGATNESCVNYPGQPPPNPPCPPNPQFQYVDNSTGILNPYLKLATQYGWANYMFETPQGPGQPSHQYLFAATSAPTASDDAAGVFASGDVSGTSNPADNNGCISPSGFTVHLIDPSGKETQNVYPCFEHLTIPDLLPAGLTWRYYAPSYPGLWNAPLAIQHICESTGSSGQCAGSDYTNNVDLNPPDVLKDIANCNLRSLSWIIPNPRSSDKPVWNDGSGPKWVSSIVNAIGASTACDGGAGYWLNTAILITWDMWAGWYDHQRPQLLGAVQGDFERGFRVPLIAVSAYTPAGFIDNHYLDFGAVARFVEQNFGIQRGALGLLIRAIVSI